MRNEPIAAIATPPGEGAIAIIRLSGKDAFDVAEKIFSRSIKNFKSHTAHYGHILQEDKEAIDSVILLVMKGPNSYTGEDSIEICCHGGSLITRKVLARVFEAGARPAEPGEFSLRAFLNGKLDLAQAEAVQELIAAKSELAMGNAKRQLEGALSEKINSIQKELIDVAAILEAWVDFPEEGLEFAAMEEIIAMLECALQKMKRLEETFEDGKVLHEGLSLCLLGSPNVGKSSLMNALLGKERAIVTEIAGTTRDLLEEDLRLGELHFKLIDTAGIRETNERIEQEGIRRSQAAMQEADLILLLLDASRELKAQDRELLALAPKEKTLVVWNKIDVKEPTEYLDAVQISAKNKIGLDALKREVEKLIWKKGPPSKEEVVITKMRHYQALKNSAQFVKAVIEGLQSGISAEFIASDMRAALHELGSITGSNVTEDILSAIFSKFCLGK
jgi:tRNA modification GTPase